MHHAVDFSVQQLSVYTLATVVMVPEKTVLGSLMANSTWPFPLDGNS